MIRFLAIFLVLFAAAAALVSFLPNPARIAAPRSAVAVQLRQEAEAAEAQSKVRVVYPALGSNDVSVASTSPAIAVGAQPVAAPAAPPATAAEPVSTAQAGAIYPQVQRVGDTGVPAPVPPNAAAQAGTPGLNLNTASIDALNQIPGAGRIGRTIASHRPYHSVEDLLTKRVLKKSVYERIKDQLAAE